MEQPSEDAPLATGRSPSLAGSEEALILPERARGGSNSKAFKVAGLTTLACFLLASQVFTAYLVINQKGQIQDLKRTSEGMQKDLTRSSHAAAVSQMRMQMPMKSLPLLTNFFDEDEKAGKIPLTKLEDTAIVSVEKQVKDLLESFQMPQFNETFLANLQSLKDQVEDSEWKGLETWMRYWLIFQMAQEKPAPPTPQPRSQWWTTAGKGLTKCQVQAAIVRPGYYQPQCDEQGHYKPMQCWHSTGYCWCVDENGNTIKGTLMRGRPVCAGGPRRMMAFPRPMLQKALKVDDK